MCDSVDTKKYPASIIINQAFYSFKHRATRFKPSGPSEAYMRQ